MKKAVWGALGWASRGAQGQECKALVDSCGNKIKIETMTYFRITVLNDVYILHSLIPHFKNELTYFKVIIIYSLDHEQTEEWAYTFW